MDLDLTTSLRASPTAAHCKVCQCSDFGEVITTYLQDPKVEDIDVDTHIPNVPTSDVHLTHTDTDREKAMEMSVVSQSQVESAMFSVDATAGRCYRVRP